MPTPTRPLVTLAALVAVATSGCAPRSPRSVAAAPPGFTGTIAAFQKVYPRVDRSWGYLFQRPVIVQLTGRLYDNRYVPMRPNFPPQPQLVLEDHIGDVPYAGGGVVDSGKVMCEFGRGSSAPIPADTPHGAEITVKALYRGLLSMQMDTVQRLYYCTIVRVAPPPAPRRQARRP